MERGAPIPAQRNGVAATEFEASPGLWQPEVQVTNGGAWTITIPKEYGRPTIRDGRVFGIFVDDARNLERFRIHYIDDQHAGMGNPYESHGIWSLDFFNPDGTGIVVNNDDERMHGRPYKLRFRKIAEASTPVGAS